MLGCNCTISIQFLEVVHHLAVPKYIVVKIGRFVQLGMPPLSLSAFPVYIIVPAKCIGNMELWIPWVEIFVKLAHKLILV